MAFPAASVCIVASRRAAIRQCCAPALVSGRCVRMQVQQPTAGVADDAAGVVRPGDDCDCGRKCLVGHGVGVEGICCRDRCLQDLDGRVQLPAVLVRGAPAVHVSAGADQWQHSVGQPTCRYEPGLSGSIGSKKFRCRPGTRAQASGTARYTYKSGRGSGRRSTSGLPGELPEPNVILRRPQIPLDVGKGAVVRS